jgi:hypothetical protein
MVLNLFEVAPQSSHIPVMLTAAAGWLELHADDTVFWVSHGVGRRLCSVIDRVTPGDRSVIDQYPSARVQVDSLLASLVRLGIAEATLLEAAVSNS